MATSNMACSNNHQINRPNYLAIYLDNATVSPPSKQVISILEKNLDCFASIASPYMYGTEAKKQVIQVFNHIHEVLQIPSSYRIIFTSGGAESLSQVVFSVWNELVRKNGKTHFIASGLSEAPSVLSMSLYESQGGKVYITKASAQGSVSLDDMTACVSPRTSLCSFPMVSGLTGVVQPITEIRALCKQRGILLHVDISHALGKTFLDLEELDADYVTVSLGPLQGPSAAGFLIVKDTSPLLPLISGQNEEFLRGGEIDIGKLKAASYALEQALADQVLYATEVARIRHSFETSLLAQLEGAQILFGESERAPHISCLSFSGVKNEALLFLLQKRGLFASIGGGVFQTISLQLRNCGVDPTSSDQAISFAFSKDTREDEVEKAVQLIVKAVHELRRLSRVFFSNTPKS